MAATGKCDFSSTGFEVCLLIRFWWSYNFLINTPYLLTRFEPLIMTPRFVTSLVWEVWGTTSWNTNSHSAETFENIKFAEDNNQLPRTAPIRTSTDVHIHKVLRFQKVHLKISLVIIISFVSWRCDVMGFSKLWRHVWSCDWALPLTLFSFYWDCYSWQMSINTYLKLSKILMPT